MNESVASSNSSVSAQHTLWMGRALELAARAGTEGEVPVGALIVRDDVVLGEGWNSQIGKADPTAHAEICVLRAAGLNQNNYRLPGATMYVTVEPCAMCAGAIIHARIAKLVFGALEPRAGAVQSKISLLDMKHFNHRVEWHGGVLAERCGLLLKNFFRERR